MTSEEEQDMPSQSLRVVVILVQNGENEDQAWQRHLMDNPQDNQADIKIFHIAWRPFGWDTSNLRGNRLGKWRLADRIQWRHLRALARLRQETERIFAD